MADTRIYRDANREILRRINREVSVRSTRFANTMLSGVFRAIFQVEKSYEFAEPEVFTLDHEPDRILWRRVDAGHASRLALALANEEILATRHQVFSEYDFVVAADVSQSMALNWWGAYGGEYGEQRKKDNPLEDLSEYKWKTPGDKTKLFLLKYALASFLHAAQANDFFSYVLLFGGDELAAYNSRQNPNLGETVLEHIDAHLAGLVRKNTNERPMIVEALRQVLARRRRAIVLCISDFVDTLPHLNGNRRPRLDETAIALALAEIASHHRLLMLRINHEHELRNQEGERYCYYKDSPYFDAEIGPNGCDNVGESGREEYNEHARAWDQRVRSALGRFGIRGRQIVAGRDDRKVDKMIYELGIETGT